MRRAVRSCGCAVEANAQMVKKFPLYKISIAVGGDEESLPVRPTVRGGIRRCLYLEKYFLMLMSRSNGTGRRQDARDVMQTVKDAQVCHTEQACQRR